MPTMVISNTMSTMIITNTMVIVMDTMRNMLGDSTTVVVGKPTYM
jgi:hypothetical protein